MPRKADLLGLDRAPSKPLFLKKKTVPNATGWWLLLTKSQFDEFDFNSYAAEDFIFTAYQKSTNKLIGKSHSLLNFAGNIPVPGIGKTFNTLCTDEDVRFELSHKHRSHVNPNSSINVYMQMLTKQINYLLDTKWGEVGLFYTLLGSFANSGVPPHTFRIAKHNGMAGLDPSTLELYEGENDEHYAFTIAGTFNGTNPKYETYTNSKGINPETLDATITHNDYDDQLFMRGGAEDIYILCPLFSEETPEHFILNLPTKGLSIKALDTDSILDPHSAMPHLIATTGVLITMDDYVPGSVLLSNLDDEPALDPEDIPEWDEPESDDE